jgi:hypothetical protein
LSWNQFHQLPTLKGFFLRVMGVLVIATITSSLGLLCRLSAALILGHPNRELVVLQHYECASQRKWYEKCSVSLRILSGL